MAEFDYDLFAIGAGSGGVRACRVSASLGARVAVAEESDLGGTCVNLGCIPKKLFVYASHFRDDFEDAAGFGWSLGDRSFDWPTLVANKDREIARLNEVYRKLLADAGVDLIEGRARVQDSNTLEIDGRTITAANILIATGSQPSVPDVPGVEFAMTSDQAFHLSELPRHAIVIGGGYIAVEFAGIFHGLDVATTQLYRGPLFLRGFDDDVRNFLASEMKRRGVDLRFESNIASIERLSGGLRATLEDGSVLETGAILYATGRVPRTRGLGLEEAGVALDEKGAVSVDAFSRSSVPSIWAIGDVTDRINLTPVAIHEGICVAKTLFGGVDTKSDHTDVASAVFSQPSIGTVGPSEAAAREIYGEIDVYRSTFRALKHTLTGRDEQAMMKLIVDRASDRVVGLHMVGADAGEIVQGFAVALKCGATKAQFDATIGIHPTSAEEFVTMRDPV
ncbi:MAG: glutathione-disulfide reductase [Myxococcales bacterium]|nr:glutathione-disulfide reductase [Myxococcales bacterium]